MPRHHDLTREPCPGRILEDLGGAFGMGALGGFLWNFVKGARNSPRYERLSGGLHAGALRAPTVGSSFAVWGGLYATFDCSFAYLRNGKEDSWNPVLSGAMTGGLLSLRSGWRSSAKNAAIGGVLLGIIEVVQLAFQRSTGEGPTPRQQYRQFVEMEQAERQAQEEAAAAAAAAAAIGTGNSSSNRSTHSGGGIRSISGSGGGGGSSSNSNSDINSRSSSSEPFLPSYASSFFGRIFSTSHPSISSGHHNSSTSSSSNSDTLLSAQDSLSTATTAGASSSSPPLSEMFQADEVFHQPPLTPQHHHHQQQGTSSSSSSSRTSPSPVAASSLFSWGLRRGEPTL